MEANYTDNILADIETDRLIAEKVMGWTWDKYKRVYRVDPDDNSLFGNGWGDDESPNGYFEPSIDIKAAWEVAEKVSGIYQFYICSNFSNLPDKQWMVAFQPQNDNDSYDDLTAYAESAPLAICRAALLAIAHIK